MQALPRRVSHCSLEQEPFEPGMEYVSHLDLDGNRKDYCQTCWEKSDKSIKGHFWKGKIPCKKNKTFAPDEKAMELFRKAADPKHRFVLALYLQRKQQLVRRTQTLYEIPDTGEIFNIEKISLSAEEAGSLAHQVHGFIV